MNIRPWTMHRDKAWDGTLETIATKGGAVGQIIINTLTASEDLFLHIFDLAVARAISVSDYSSTVAGTVLATCSIDHGLGVAGAIATVTVAGTTNYNGAVTVTVVDGLKFYYTETYVAVETGTFKTLITAGTTVSDLTIKVGHDIDGMAGTRVVTFPEPGFPYLNDLQILGTTTYDGATGAPTLDTDITILLR